MANLSDILNKSKGKIDNNTVRRRKRLNIAQTARPYDEEILVQPDTKPDTKPDTNNLSKDYENQSLTIYQLEGNEKKLMLFLCENIQKNQKNETDPLTKNQLANLAKISPGSVATTIKRLEKKLLLKRKNILRGGRNAKHVFSVSNRCLKEVKNL